VSETELREKGLYAPSISKKKGGEIMSQDIMCKGVENADRACYTYTNEELFFALKNLAEKLGRTPRKKEVDSSDECPSSGVYYLRFGTLTNAIRLAGLKPNRITKAEAMFGDSPY
jgi:Homing endonuclease associated repeat